MTKSDAIGVLVFIGLIVGVVAVVATCATTFQRQVQETYRYEACLEKVQDPKHCHQAAKGEQ